MNLIPHDDDPEPAREGFEFGETKILVRSPERINDDGYELILWNRFVDELEAAAKEVGKHVLPEGFTVEIE